MDGDAGLYLRSLRTARFPTRYDLAQHMQDAFPGRSLETIATDIGVIERQGTAVLDASIVRKRVPFAQVLGVYLAALRLDVQEFEQLCRYTHPHYVLEWKKLTSPDSAGEDRYPPASSGGTHSAA